MDAILSILTAVANRSGIPVVINSADVTSDKHSDYLPDFSNHTYFTTEALTDLMEQSINSTQNGTTLSINIDFMSIVCCLLCLTTITGNMLVIIAFIKDEPLRIISNYWLISLSFTDIILAVIVMPFSVMLDITQGVWLLGPVMCDVFICLDVLCSTSSIYHLCLISIDRFLQIQFPFTYPQRRNKCTIIMAITVSWIMCLTLSTARLMGWKDSVMNTLSCEMTNRSYRIASSILSFYLPLSITALMYSLIYRITLMQVRRFEEQQTQLLNMPLQTHIRARHYGALYDKREATSETDRRPSSSVFNTSYCQQTDHNSKKQAQRDTIMKMCEIALHNPVPPPKPRQRRSRSQSYGVFAVFSNAPRASGVVATELLQDEDSVDHSKRKVRVYRFPLDGRGRLQHSAKKHALISGLANSLLICGHNGTSLPNERSRLLSNQSRSETIGTHVVRAIRSKEYRKELIERRKSIFNSKAKSNAPLNPTATKLLRLTGLLTQETDRQKRERKAARIMMIVLSVFITCWSPFFILNVLDAIFDLRPPPITWRVVVWLGYTNSAVNPFLYTYFNTSFRKTIFHIICCNWV